MLCWSCSSVKTQKPLTHIVVSHIRDISDSLRYRPDGSALYKFFGLESDDGQAATFRYRTISSYYLEKTDMCLLPNAVEMEKENVQDNIHYRTSRIRKFQDDITQTLRRSKSYTSGDTILSECLRTITAEIEQVTAIPADEYYVIIASNLQENSDIFSVTNPQDLTQLMEHLDAVVTRFSSLNWLPKITHNLTVVLTYQPWSKTDEIYFLRMAYVYQRLLEKANIRVVINANL